MKNAHVENNEANDLNVVTTALLNVEIVVEGMTSKKTTGFVLHARMSISLGEQNATVVEKAKMGTSKPTNLPSGTTTAQTIVEADLNRNVMDATIGFAHRVATTTSRSVQNATNVESRKQEEAGKDGLLEAFQIVANVAAETQTDAVETVTVAVDSVEAVVEIQTGVVETVTEAVVLVATETVVMIDVTLDEVVQAVIATMSVQMSVIEKPEENGQAMHTTEDLNPFVLDAIKARIETTEVNGRDSRSPLLGCA